MTKNIKSLNIISTSTHFNVRKSQAVMLPYVTENTKYLQCMIVMPKLFSKSSCNSSDKR